MQIAKSLILVMLTAVLAAISTVASTQAAGGAFHHAVVAARSPLGEGTGHNAAHGTDATNVDSATADVAGVVIEAAAAWKPVNGNPSYPGRVLSSPPEESSGHSSDCCHMACKVFVLTTIAPSAKSLPGLLPANLLRVCEPAAGSRGRLDRPPKIC